MTLHNEHNVEPKTLAGDVEQGTSAIVVSNNLLQNHKILVHFFWIISSLCPHSSPLSLLTSMVEQISTVCRPPRFFESKRKGGELLIDISHTLSPRFFSIYRQFYSEKLKWNLRKKFTWRFWIKMKCNL